MLKLFYQFIKKFFVSIFILYGYNLIAAPLNLMIPINFITVSVLTILGFPSLLSFIVILLVVF